MTDERDNPTKPMNRIQNMVNPDPGHLIGCIVKGRGVRQGCPISPLLFAAAVDILLRKLHSNIQNSTTKAFANDIAMVVEDWRRDHGAIQDIFKEFEAMSGLDLNMSKTCVVPL